MMTGSIEEQVYFANGQRCCKICEGFSKLTLVQNTHTYVEVVHFVLKKHCTHRSYRIYF
jgi:hypothetical protein